MKKFKEIKNYESYLINEDGLIFSTKSNTLLKHSRSKNGYHSVVLTNENGSKTHETHILVWDTLVGCDRIGFIIDHMDECKTNNKLSNLQKITQRENVIKYQKTQYEKKTSRFVGTCWNKKTNNWRSYITIKGKNIHLGTSSDEMVAHQMYLDFIEKNIEVL